MKPSDLSTSEYNSYYKHYFETLPENLDLFTGFTKGKAEIIHFFENLPEEKLNYQYAPDKWTVKEVFQHLIDTEQIFAYRMFRIGRHDKSPLAGFDQDPFITFSNATAKNRLQLLEEFEAVRNNSIAIFKGLSTDDLLFIGEASGAPLSARAAGFFILGHYMWHLNIIKERYL